MNSLIDVFAICVEYPVDEMFEPGWTVDIYRVGSPLNPGSEDRVSDSERVIRVKMRDEDSIESGRRLTTRSSSCKRLHAFQPSGSSASAYSGSRVEQVRD